MRKIPSYPKITTKTNITFTHTQNININSPKSLGLAGIGQINKKGFKAHKEKESRESRQRPNTSDAINLKAYNQNKSKTKLNSNNMQKHHKDLQIKKDYSTNNLNSKKQQSHSSLKNQNQQLQQKKKPKTQDQQQIKKLQQKLKFLQKKIDTLKHQKQKSKKQKSKQLSSRRSRSKLKEKDNCSSSLIANNDSKASLMNNYLKKREAHISTNHSNVSNSSQSNKILKKSYSDKNIIKAKMNSRPPLKKNNQINTLMIQKQKEKLQQNYQVEEAQQNQEEVIHKFVTQVAKNQKMVQHHNHSKNLVKAQSFVQTCYYIENISKSLHDSDLMIYRQHLIQSIQTISYLQNIRKPSLKQLEKHSMSLSPSKHKYCIVLDLDETLIHCNQHIDVPHDVSLKIKFPTGEKIDAGVNIRPFAKELLKNLSQFCQIIVFTASHQCYANVVLDHLDPKHEYVSHRLYRNHCWQTQQGIYIKDLRVLKNRQIQNLLLVDNAAYSYFYQLQNGIPIIPFYDDKQDEQLQLLVKYIKTIIHIKQTDQYLNTLQKVNHNYFKLSHYHQFQDLELLVKKLYENTVSQFKMIHQ